MNPKISIITISYNNKEGLEKTLKSVTSQDYKDFEYIVIDGGSKDGSKEIIEKYSHKISHWVSEPDKGIYHAMNKGIEAAKGEYLLFINSGDELFRSNILTEVSPDLYGADIISGNINTIGENTTYIANNPKVLQFRTFYQWTLQHECTFIKKTGFNRVGLYDEDLKIVSDWKWFLIAVGRFELTYKKIEKTIANFYLDGISSNPENFKLHHEERRKTLKEEFPLFITDYENLIAYEEKMKILSKIKKSRWYQLGKKLGLMKNIDL